MTYLFYHVGYNVPNSVTWTQQLVKETRYRDYKQADF